MSTYNPDYWRVLKVRLGEGELHYRVIASWSGSYVWGSSWKISSGIEGFVDKGDHYESPQNSGSTYLLSKDREGMSGIMSGIFQNYQDQCKEEYGDDFVFELIDLEQFFKEYEAKNANS